MKQTCEYTGRLHLMKDGELSNGEQARVLKHLQHCETCRAEWVSLSRLGRLMRGLDDVSPSAGFDRAFRDKVDAYEQRRPGRLLEWLLTRPARRMLVPVAATLVLCAGVYLSVHTVNIPPDDMALSDQIDLLEDFDVVEHLDLLENWETINRMSVNT